MRFLLAVFLLVALACGQDDGRCIPRPGLAKPYCSGGGGSGGSGGQG